MSELTPTMLQCLAGKHKRDVLYDFPLALVRKNTSPWVENIDRAEWRDRYLWVCEFCRCAFVEEG